MDKKKTLKIVIFGGSGSLGKNIVKFLEKKNFDITVVKRKKNIPFQKIEKSKNEIYLKEEKITTGILFSIIKEFDLIINCVGESNNKKKMYESNVYFLKNLVNALTNCHKKKFIHFSTCSVYGSESSSSTNINEDTPHNPFTFYESTKSKGENYIKKMQNKNNFNYIIIQPSQILGIGMSNQSIKKIYFFLKIKLFFFIRDVKPIFSYIFIDDLCLILEKIINSKKKIYNRTLLISNKISLLKLILLIKNKFEFKGSVRYISLNYFTFLTKFFRFFNLNFPIKERTLTFLLNRNTYSNEKVIKLFNIKILKNINKKNIKDILN
jgi:nucleoside-diphosphate-sugar epimerase